MKRASVKWRIAILSIVFIATGLVATAYMATRPGPELICRGSAETARTSHHYRFAVINGLRVRYVDEGAGPVVLLLGGHTSGISEFDGLIPVLRTDFRVISLEMPGTGCSEKPERSYTLAFYEDMAIGLLDHLAVQRAQFAGGSLGGNLAIRLGHRYPERTERVVAWAPAGAWEARPIGARIMRLIGGRVMFWPTVRWQSSFWYTDDNPDAERNRAAAFAYYKDIMSEGFIDMYWGMAADQVGTSLFAIAADVTVPVVLLHAEHDTTPGMTEGLLRLDAGMARSCLKVIPGAGHAIALEKPKLLYNAVRVALSGEGCMH